MNENLDNSKKDIKPERPEPASNRGQRKTRGGGVLFSSTLTVINSIGLIVLFLWFFNTSGNQQQAGQNFVERISLLEETSEITQDQLDEFRGELDDDLKFVNKEIRKLWDLSNKRNKQRIATLEDQLNSIDSSIKEIFTQSQEIRLISKEFSKSISDIKTRVAKIDASNLSSPDYELRIKDLEEAVNSMDSFRRQTNQSILKLKEELSKSISDKENSESNSLPIEN